MHSIPVKTLNLRENSYYGSKKGKRMGFAVYTELTCKQCKPDRFFHKREGLRLHNVIQHGRGGSMIMRTSQSLPIKLSGAPAAVSNTRVTRAKSNPLGLGTQPGDIQDVDYADDDDDVECVEIVEVGENHIKSFKPKNYKWKEVSPLYQPEVLLMNSLNLKMREVNTSFDEVEMFIPPSLITENIGQHEENVDDDEIVVLDNTILLKSSRAKRRSVGGDRDLRNSESKRGRRDDDELLLVEDESDDTDDLVNIQNLLEVTIMEENEIIEVELEPEEVDLEPEDVEVLHLDEQNNIEDLKLKPY